MKKEKYKLDIPFIMGIVAVVMITFNFGLVIGFAFSVVLGFLYKLSSSKLS